MATTKKTAAEKDTSSLGFTRGEFISFGGYEEDDTEFASKPTLSSIPLLKLMQNQSPEALDRKLRDILPGNIIVSKENTLPGTVDADGFNYIDGYIVEYHRARLKFQPKEQGNGIECSCPTMYMKGEQGTRYGVCANCRYNHEGHFRDPGACQAQFNLVIAAKDADGTWKTYRVMCNKSSYGKAFELTKMLQLARKYHKERTGGTPIPCYAFKVRLSSKHITGNYDFYTYEFTLLRANGTPIAYDKKNEQAYGATTEFGVTQEDANELLTIYNEIKELRDAQLERHNEVVSGRTNDAPQDVQEEAVENINSLLADTVTGYDDADVELPF